jgi:hypothetical protein
LLTELQDEMMTIDGVDLRFDFGRRNHFIGVFRVAENPSSIGFSHVAILHCSSPELRDTPNDVLNPSSTSRSTLSTPAGSIDYIAYDAATDYIARFEQAAAFAARKREAIGEALFPGSTVLSNRLHQGCVGVGEIVVGAHAQTSTDDRSGFVYLLGLTSPSFLYKISGSAAVLPHGGGARYDFLASSETNFDDDGQMRLLLTTHTGNVLSLRTTQDLPYSYRGRDTFEECLSTGLLVQESELAPVYCLRV